MWTLFVLAAMAAVGCSEPTCVPGTKQTEPGVCHVPGGGGGSGAVATVAAAGRGVLIDEVDEDASGGVGGAAGSAGDQTKVMVDGGSGGMGGMLSAGSGGQDHALGLETHVALSGSGGLWTGPIDGGGAGGTSQPVATCGNGKLDSGELCDGNCAKSCDDNNPCTADHMLGSPATCDVFCVHSPLGEGSACGDNAYCNNDGSCLANCQVGSPKCASQTGTGSCVIGSSWMNCDGGKVCLATYIASGATCGPGLTCDDQHNCR